MFVALPMAFMPMQLVSTLICGVHGAIPSVTVTVAWQVAELPHGSVTVRVTRFAPRFAHVNVFGITVNVRYGVAAQLSNEPLSTSDGSRISLPVLSKGSVRFLHKAVGGFVSRTVITCVWISMFPAQSVTFQVRVSV